MEDFLAKLNEEVIQCRINLFLNVATVLLAILDRSVDELCIFWLLRRSENQ